MGFCFFSFFFEKEDDEDEESGGNGNFYYRLSVCYVQIQCQYFDICDF